MHHNSVLDLEKVTMEKQNLLDAMPVSSDIRKNLTLASLIELAIKHKEYIFLYPEMYFTKAPFAKSSGLCHNYQYTIGELLDMWNLIPETSMQCPKCFAHAHMIGTGALLSLGGGEFICPSCGANFPIFTNANLIRYLVNDIVAAFQKMDKERGTARPEGLEWEKFVERLLQHHRESEPHVAPHFQITTKITWCPKENTKYTFGRPYNDQAEVATFHIKR